MRAFVGVSQVAVDAINRRLARHEGKVLRRFVAALNFHFAEVQRPCVDAGRRPSLETHELNTEAPQRIRQLERGALTVRSAVKDTLADDDSPAKVSATSQDDCLC